MASIRPVEEAKEKILEGLPEVQALRECRTRPRRHLARCPVGRRGQPQSEKSQKTGIGGKPTIVKAKTFNDYFNVKDQWVSLDKPNMDSRPELYDELSSVMNTAYAP